MQTGRFSMVMNMNPDATERAAKEAYFRLWLSQKKIRWVN